MSLVRSLEAADVPAVAAMFQRMLRNIRSPPPASLNQLPGLEAPGAVTPEIRPRRSTCAPPQTTTFVIARPPKKARFDHSFLRTRIAIL